MARTAAFMWKGLSEFTRQAYLARKANFDPSDTSVDLSGRAIVITGGNQGIGFAAAEELAKKGASIYLVSRSQERGEEARKRLAASSSDDRVHLRICDMGVMAQVRTLASEFASEEFGGVYALVNNAGCLLNERQVTDEGREKNFATNTLGPFLLTELLLPHTERVVMVSSGGAYTQDLRHSIDNLDMERGSFDGTAQYAKNKRQQIALAEHWSNSSSKIAVSMHPGWADTTAVRQSLPGFHKRMQGKLRRPEEGADTVVWLVCCPERKIERGAFYLDRQPQAKSLQLVGSSNRQKDVDTLVHRLRNLSGLS